MLKGCISLGDIECDGCQRTIEHSERYLIIDGDDDTKGQDSKTVFYCVECTLDRGLAHYRNEKGEKILTFFPQSEY